MLPLIAPSSAFRAVLVVGAPYRGLKPTATNVRLSDADPPIRLCLPAPSEQPMFILPVERPEPVRVEAGEREETQRRAA